jgi:hypothetical protein
LFEILNLYKHNRLSFFKGIIVNQKIGQGWFHQALRSEEKMIKEN